MDNQSQLQPPPDAFIEPMLKLRDYYGSEVEKFELLHRQALENLNHVEALLGAWSSSADATSSITAADQEDFLTQASSITISEPLVNTTQPDTLVNTDIAAEQEGNSTTTKGDNITQLSFDWTADSEVAQTQESTANTSIQSPSLLNETQTEDNTLSYSEIPMLPQYRELTRTLAIQKLLQEHVGTVCHIDFIVLTLYGDYDPHRFKVVKGRVQSTLTQGRESNKWFAIPGQPGCYTLVLSLVSPASGTGSSKKGSSKSRKPSPQADSNIVPMLEPYKEQFLIDALTSLFRENPLRVFNVAEVIQAIYGELNAEQKREVKSKVLNELSRGHRIGRFSRVPNETGLYTWDAKLLQQTKAK